MWLIAVVGVAPCQCFSPGGHTTTSPARISRLGPPEHRTHPHPAVSAADRRFLVGPVPGAPGVLVASACSGHGFKFAPVLGAALADLVSGVARTDLEFLSPARLALGDPV